jgi:hypothetical protein
MPRGWSPTAPTGEPSLGAQGQSESTEYEQDNEVEDHEDEEDFEPYSRQEYVGSSQSELYQSQSFQRYEIMTRAHCTPTPLLTSD